jgi:hypothetical protein
LIGALNDALPIREHRRLRLRFEDREDLARRPTLLDVSSAIYDFELAYELALILSADRYSDYPFTQAFFVVGRNRPVRRDDQPRVERVGLESPLEVILSLPPEVLVPGTVAAVSGTVATLYGVLRIVFTADLKLRTARTRARAELDAAEVERLEQQARRLLAERDAEAIADALSRRTGTHRLHLMEVEELPPRESERPRET